TMAGSAFGAEWSHHTPGTIVFHSSPPGLGRFDLYTMDNVGGNKTKLTTSSAFSEADGDWSPDGSKIYFNRNPFDHSSDTEIWVMNADGTVQTQLTDNTEQDMHPSS